LGRTLRFGKPGRLITAGLGLAYLGCLGLGLYEITAKSPSLLGDPLPGWWATVQAENTTRWDPPTGLGPLDRLLHEGEEALRFYGILARPAKFPTPGSTSVSRSVPALLQVPQQSQIGLVAPGRDLSP
jgi:hypothetical protein